MRSKQQCAGKSICLPAFPFCIATSEPRQWQNWYLPYQLETFTDTCRLLFNCFMLMTTLERGISFKTMSRMRSSYRVSSTYIRCLVVEKTSACESCTNKENLNTPIMCCKQIDLFAQLISKTENPYQLRIQLIMSKFIIKY